MILPWNVLTTKGYLNCDFARDKCDGMVIPSPDTDTDTEIVELTLGEGESQTCDFPIESVSSPEGISQCFFPDPAIVLPIKLIGSDLCPQYIGATLAEHVFPRYHAAGS